MSFHRSPFSEVRAHNLQATLFIVATAALATSGSLIGVLLLPLGLR